MDLWDKLLGRKIDLIILEDNQATIKVIRDGYSQKLRSTERTHKVNLGSVTELIKQDDVSIEYVPTDFQAADIFTKALPPHKWQAALDLLGMA